MPGFQRDVMGAGASALLAATINGQGQASQTATGTTQATAFQITTCSTEFTTVALNSGAILIGPTAGVVGPGDICAVYNQGANPLTVYPPVGFKIGTGATNAGVAVAAGKSALFGARGDGNYFVFLSA